MDSQSKDDEITTEEAVLTSVENKKKENEQDNAGLADKTKINK